MPKHVPIIKRGAKPIGPYSIAAEAIGRPVFISGQVAIDPESGEKETGDAAAQATRIMENLALVLGDLGIDFDHVVKTTIFLIDMGDFAAVNEVYGRYFPGKPPARSTVQVGALPGGFRVEIEAIAAL
jgi:2-iminobutanoate/2-iminopropanoate deaminase